MLLVRKAFHWPSEWEEDMLIVRSLGHLLTIKSYEPRFQLIFSPFFFFFLFDTIFSLLSPRVCTQTLDSDYL